MEMYRSTRVRNKTSSNMRMKASSLYFLNDISNIDTVDGSTNSDNWRDSYTFNPMIIGRGHFSKVYKVKCCSTGTNAAIKIIRRRRLGTDKIDEIMQEIEIMQLLNKSSNTAFIQLLKVHTSPSEVAIVMEFASGGSLYHVTQDSKTGLSEVYVQIVLTKLLSALSVIHRHDIVHLDIKADNILLRHPYQSTDVVLIDFGLAKRLTKSKVHKEMIGTPDYIAPEVLNYEQICLKSDMWSMGVLTFFLLTNISPFSGDSKEDTLNKVTKTQFEFVGHLKEDNMHLARNFINSLLVKIPENRLSADDCMCHEFLANVSIMECHSDKASCPEAPIINLDHQVQVRQNTSYTTRGMVMSQYDICSSDINDNSCPSMDDLLQGHCDPCDDIVPVNEGIVSPLVDDGVSVDSMGQLNEDVVDKPYDNDTERMPIDLIICDLMESDVNNNCGEDIPQDDEEEEMPDLPVVDLLHDCELEYEFPSKDAMDHCPDEMGTSIFVEDITHEDIMPISDSGNHHPHEVQTDLHLSRTKVRESRRRLMPMPSTSFRNSRENIIDVNNNDKGSDCCVPTKDIVPSQSNTIDSRRGDTVVSRRVHMSRSLRRDSDKPHTDKWNRRSQFEPTIPDVFNTDNCNGRSHDFTKSNPSLLHAASEPHKRHSLSKSAHLSSIPANDSKRTQSKIQRLVSNLKPKASEKKKSTCVIS